MKKISLLVICAVTAFIFASCQAGEKADNNNRTPKDVVDEMYKAIQAGNFDEAAAFTKIPDAVKMEEEKVYKEFANNPREDGKVIIAGEEWRNFVVNKMQEQSADFSLDSWEIVSEEVSNTDPNSAKVKTKIHITNKGVASEADCSFPLKRENGVWLIIG